MHKLLIIEAFKKGKEKLEHRGNKKPSSTRIAEELSAYIEEKEGFLLGERRFRDYYNEAKSQEENNEDIHIVQSKVIKGLYSYLGFDDYETFVSAKTKNGDSDKEHTTNSFIGFVKENWIILITVALIIATFFVVNLSTQERWMEWKGDRYVEVVYDASKLKEGKLKPFDKKRVESFRKIEPDCKNTTFFNPDGLVKIWYGKNALGEYEYFTDLARHPETNKTLKEITKYMSETHICSNQ